MSKRNTLVALCLAVLALAMVGAVLVARHPASKVGVSSVSAATRLADDPNAPVVRFVKDPESAPPIHSLDISGKPVSNTLWSGKVVIVNFWATWCPPCREEIPELLELKRIYGDQLEIIGISEDEDGPEVVAKFAQHFGVHYPIVMATPELIQSVGGVPALPTSFLIDTQGRVVQKHTGLYPIEKYHLEIRTLLGLPTDARVETFVDSGQIFLKNAANATELPDVDFKGLNPDQKKQALHRMNAETCTCGCKLTISQCRVNDTECDTSRGLAAKIVQETAQSGKASTAPDSKATPSTLQ